MLRLVIPTSKDLSMLKNFPRQPGCFHDELNGHDPPFFFHIMASAAVTVITPPAAMYRFVRSGGSSSPLGKALEGYVAHSASCCRQQSIVKNKEGGNLHGQTAPGYYST
jgi:hypothetical protein